MGPALTDHNAFHQRTALETRLALASINAEIVLKISTAVDPIDAGAVMFNSRQQNLLNGLVEPFSFS